MNIFERLAKVQADIAAKGIAKAQKNEYDRYMFRGIDDLYNVLGPIFADHGVVSIPVLQSTDTKQMQTSKGALVNYTKVVVEYHFCAPDGSTVVSKVPGEAMDRGDKSENKAMSAAYKNCMFQLFCIPVEGESSDSEEETHEIQGKPEPEPEELTPNQVAQLKQMVEG